jgi:hypothetical protein
MNGPLPEIARRSTAVRESHDLADNRCSQRCSPDHVRARQRAQRACVVSNRPRLTALGTEHMSAWSPRLIAEHTNSHNDRAGHRTNDLSLPVEQKPNQAGRDPAVIMRGHQHHAEGLSG